ncbi:MAG: hypothetical protein Q4G27_05455 [Flavobacteriaceae bacterium]|nr:hypothetical protein [Flavobacteriaceae bacterium]
MNYSYKKNKQDSLAFELCQIYGFDQGIRLGHFVFDGKPNGLRMEWSLIHAVDTVNFNKIVQFVRKNGFPRNEILGENNMKFECVKAAAHAVLLHNPHRLINEKEYFNLFLSEVEKGNLQMDNFIFYLDKYYIIRRDSLGNSKILYGSQFGKPCLKYRKKSDSVRAEIGLPPLQDSMFIHCN